MGGSWKRMIGTVKLALKFVMTRRRMHDETFTVFGEVERIVNSRPLTHVSDDNHDPHTQPFPDWRARSQRMPVRFW
jgi:hypothetical protein